MKTLMKLDSYGSRKKHYSKIYGAEPLLSSSVIANVFILVMTACDFFTNYSMWNMVLHTQLLIKYMITLSTAVLLDLPMGIAATALKQHQQGMRSKEGAIFINVLAIGAFLLVLIMTSVVRINAKDICFPDIEQEKTRLLVAVGISLLPAATSLGAYAISYACANPKNDRLKKFWRLKCSLEARIADLEAADKQADFNGGYLERSKELENALREAHNNSIDAQVKEAEQYSALAIMTHIAADADQISTITARSKELLADQEEDNSVSIC